MKISPWAAVVAITATAAAAYVIRHARRYGIGASTPAEAWLTARICRKKLDRELDKILRDTDKR